MAESYGFFNDNSGDRTYLDDALAAPFGALAGSPGVAPFITDALKPSIGTGLEVKIAAGFAFGGVLPGWWYRSTAETSNILDAAESGKKRIDLITLCFDRNTEQRTVTRKVIQGIETTGEPIEPSLTQNETLYELAIAAVKVDDSDVLSLVDKRSFIKAGHVIHNNRLINSGFNINQRVVSGTVTLTAGEYGHDQWKAGASGCTYTFTAADNITTLTITAGSLIQVVEGLGLVTDDYTLSWEGTAQAKIAAGGYADSPLSANITGGTNTNIEFGIGTVTKPKLEQGVIATDYVRGGFSEELAKCLRFYQKTYDYAVAPGTVTPNGAVVECAARNAATKTAGFMFQCSMAATPTVVFYSPVTGTSGNIDNDGDKAATAASIGEKGIGYISVPSGVTTSDASYHLVLKAEL